LDIEQGARVQATEILQPFFMCYEEVNSIEQSGGKIRADIFAVSVESCSQPIVFAVEVKSHANDEPGKFKDTVFHASKCVHASVSPKERDDLSSLSIDAALVFPAPTYHWYGKRSENDGREFILIGIAFLAERWNVGRLIQRKSDWEIVFGSNDVWSKKKGWMGNAKSGFPNKGVLTNLDIEREDYGPFGGQDC
jgi:hypothetical protein